MTDVALLIKKYLKDELDQQERVELELWKEQSAVNRQLFEELTDDEYLVDAVSDAYKISSDAAAREKMHALINANRQPVVNDSRGGNSIRTMWFRLSAAAVFFIAVFGIVYLMKRNEQPPNAVTVTKATQEIVPGTYKATLQLADGRSIVLDSAAMGQLAEQGGTQVQNKNGKLVYAESGNAAEKRDLLWNTLSTGRGQTYPLQLSDGSKAWLNSESSIRFPVSFTGDKREVQITGEVYFEIAHDANKPFKVTAKDIHVQVLGTMFNVNAYADESAIKTTLLAGSVQVAKGDQVKKIKPGQQVLALPNDIKVIDHVDTDKITAWKQGYFMFREDKLSEAIKNIARWYNVEVVFEGNAANVDVSGTISRSANLSELIKLLAAIDVQARVEGQRLILKAQ